MTIDRLQRLFLLLLSIRTAPMRLEKDGLVEAGYRCVTIPDKEKLRAWLKRTAAVWSVPRGRADETPLRNLSRNRRLRLLTAVGGHKCKELCLSTGSELQSCCKQQLAAKAAIISNVEKYGK